MKKYSVLFICTGNICRSPTFEGVFKYLLSENKISRNFFIDSAGTRSYHIGETADIRSINYAGERGYDLSEIRSRQVCNKDFSEFDLLLALDRSHYDELISISPRKYTSKIKLILSYINYESLHDVPDPYYGKKEDFERVLDLAEECCDRLLKKLIKKVESSK